MPQLFLPHIEGDSGARSAVWSLPSLDTLYVSPGAQAMTWHLSRGGEIEIAATFALPRGIEVHTRSGESRLILSDPKRNLYLAHLSADENWIVFTAREASEGQPRIYAAPFHRDRATPISDWVELCE